MKIGNLVRIRANYNSTPLDGLEGSFGVITDIIDAYHPSYDHIDDDRMNIYEILVEGCKMKFYGSKHLEVIKSRKKSKE